MKFIVYRDAKKEYRWRLVAANGNVVADGGEGYKNRQDCLSTIASIKTTVADAPIEGDS